jgi:hypothetical protein
MFIFQYNGSPLRPPIRRQAPIEVAVVDDAGLERAMMRQVGKLPNGINTESVFPLVSRKTLSRGSNFRQVVARATA